MSAEVKFGIETIDMPVNRKGYATVILFHSIVTGAIVSRTAIFPVVAGPATATKFLVPLTRRATGRRLRNPLRPRQRIAKVESAVVRI